MFQKLIKKLRARFSSLESKGSTTNKSPLRRKMVIVGDSECGKTCLVTRMCIGQFLDDGYIPNVFDADVVNVNTGKEEVNLTLFDTTGQEEYDRLRPYSYNEVDVVIICFSLADTDTLTNVTEKWSPEMKHFCGDKPIMLVGNKKDLRESLHISFEPSPLLSLSSTPHRQFLSSHSIWVEDREDESTQNDNDAYYNKDDESTKPNGSQDSCTENFKRIHTNMTPRVPFHVQAPVKHIEGSLVANQIGAIAYFETSALSGDNVEELLSAVTKASVIGAKKSRSFKPFVNTLKSWKSICGLEKL